MSAVIEAGVAVSFTAAGVVAWRPHRRTGALMIAVGLLWTLARFPPPLPGAAPVAAALTGAWAAVLLHLVLSFPDGRPTGRSARLLVAGGYGCALLAGAPAVTGADQRLGLVAGTAGAAVVGGLAFGAQLRRWQRSSPARRRSLTPVWQAAAVVTALAVALKPWLVAGEAASVLAPTMQLALAAVPVGYLAGMLRRRMDRGLVAELVTALDGQPRPAAGLQRALARTLHDPTLRIGLWQPATGRYLDPDGLPLAAAADPGAVTVPVQRHGRPLALLRHDPALRDHPELVRAACAATALALHSHRVAADAEAARRRLERDLHDGVQQQLLAVPMTLSLAESLLAADQDRVLPLLREARHTSLAALAEVRSLAQRGHPAVLTERGLAGAVRELAALSPVPVRVWVDVDPAPAAEVESAAYFVVAEALANLTRYARATRAEVRVARRGAELTVVVGDDGHGGADPGRGSGLRGLAARVAEAGGSLAVDSPVGRGTRVRAVLPCA